MGSLSGPWLTLMFPAAAAFAIHDRRTGARFAGWGLAIVTGGLTAGSGMGVVLLAVSAAALIGTAWEVLHGSGLGLGRTALPALGAAAAVLIVAPLLAPEAWALWEAGLRDGVEESANLALERYRRLGMNPATLEALDRTTAAAATVFVRLWPALVALGAWLGSWLGYRLLARWGRVEGSLARRMHRRPFDRFHLPEASIWAVIVALGLMWAPVGGAQRIAINTLFAAGALFGLQGLAVSAWWTARQGMGGVARVLFITLGLLFLSPVVVAGAILIGLADHWLAVREEPAAS